jgi:hypothetical protein
VPDRSAYLALLQALPQALLQSSWRKEAVDRQAETARTFSRRDALARCSDVHESAWCGALNGLRRQC